MSIQSIDESVIQTTPVCQTEDIIDEILFFVDKTDTSIRIPIKYSLIKKWSTLIDTIEWKNTECKEVQLPIIPNLKTEETVTHLKCFLLKLTSEKVTPTLRTSFSWCGLPCVPGTIQDLHYQLLISLYLDVPVFTQEIIDTLNCFRVNVSTDLKTYVLIYGTILRDQNSIQKYLLNLKDRFLSSPIQPMSEEIQDILTKIIHNLKDHIYDRFYLTRMYDLPFPPVPDSCDDFVARRLYLFTDGMTLLPEIEHELLLIKSTKRSIIETIQKYGSAVRVAQDADPNLGCFWFYCGDCKDGLVNVGSVTIDDRQYEICIENCYLSSRHQDFDTDCTPSVYNLLSEEVFDVNYVSSAVYLSFLKNVSERISGYNMTPTLFHQFLKQVNEIEFHDKNFRSWLHDRDMLGNEEINFLHRHHLNKEAQKQLDTLTHQVSKIGSDQINEDLVHSPGDGLNHPDLPNMYDTEEPGLSVDDKNARIYNLFLRETAVCKQRRIDLHMHQLAYYSQPSIIKLELERDTFRSNFLAKTNRYEGIVVMSQIYTLDSTTYPGRILVNFDTSCIDSTWFNQKRVIQRTNLKPIIGDTESSQIIHSLGIDFNYDYRPNVFPFMMPFMDFRRSADIHYRGFDFEVIDPSTIPNIEDVKTSSHPANTTKVTLMAYPHDNPVIYFKSALPDKPYIWYKFTLDKNNIKEIIDISNSDTADVIVEDTIFNNKHDYEKYYEEYYNSESDSDV
jgi:hypothetical protein